MRNKLTNILKSAFSNFEMSLRSIILVFVPLITLFSVMSDRSPYNYINIVLYGIEIVLMLFYVWKWKKFRFDILTVYLIIFNLTILLSQIVNKRISEYPTTILLLSIFAIVFYQFVYSEKNKNLIYRLIVFGGLLFAAYFIFTYRKDLLSLNFADRLGRDFSDQNDMAKYLSIFGLLSIIDLYQEKRFWKIFPVVSILVFVLLILISGSVSNLLCFIVTGILVLIFSSKRKNRLFVAVGILIMAGFVYGIIQLPFMSYFKTRIDGIFNAFFEPGEKVDGSASDRIKLFVEGFELFLTRPFLGYGYDQVQYYTHGVGMFSHSNIAELLASFGVVGFLAFEALIVYPLYYAFKNDKYKKEAITTLFYLFIFQFFLIIFRKKIEFMLIPLGFACIVEGDSPALEVSFVGFKPMFIKQQPVQIKPKKKILLIYAKDDDDTLMLPASKYKGMISKEFDIQTCLITDKNSDLRYDFVLNKNTSNFMFKRSAMDLLDKTNPTFIITSKEYCDFISKAAFGKNVKIINFINESDLIREKQFNRKIYCVIEKKEPFDSESVKQKNIDNNVIKINNFNNKEELNNLLNLLTNNKNYV